MSEDYLEKNCKAYEKVKGELEAKHFGRVALFHDGKLQGIYNDSDDAYQVGCKYYGLGNFTIHKIGEKPIDLGFQTLCLPGAFKKLGGVNSY